MPPIKMAHSAISVVISSAKKGSLCFVILLKGRKNGIRSSLAMDCSNLGAATVREIKTLETKTMKT